MRAWQRNPLNSNCLQTARFEKKYILTLFYFNPHITVTVILKYAQSSLNTKLQNLW